MTDKKLNLNTEFKAEKGIIVKSKHEDLLKSFLTKEETLKAKRKVLKSAKRKVDKKHYKELNKRSNLYSIYERTAEDVKQIDAITVVINQIQDKSSELYEKIDKINAQLRELRKDKKFADKLLILSPEELKQYQINKAKVIEDLLYLEELKAQIFKEHKYRQYNNYCYKHDYKTRKEYYTKRIEQIATVYTDATIQEYFEILFESNLNPLIFKEVTEVTYYIEFKGVHLFGGVTFRFSDNTEYSFYNDLSFVNSHIRDNPINEGTHIVKPHFRKYTSFNKIKYPDGHVEDSVRGINYEADFLNL